MYGKDNIKLLDRARKLKPDLIVYTGDIVDSKAKSNDRVISLCKELADVAPSYYIYGNNEVEMYYDIPLTQESLDKKFGFNDNNRQPDKLLEITDDLTRKLEATGPFKWMSPDKQDAFRHIDVDLLDPSFDSEHYARLDDMAAALKADSTVRVTVPVPSTSPFTATLTSR